MATESARFSQEQHKRKTDVNALESHPLPPHSATLLSFSKAVWGEKVLAITHVCRKLLGRENPLF